MAHEADAVGVVAGQDTILIPKRIGGADRACPGMFAHSHGKSRLLVWQGNIATSKALGGHTGKKLSDLTGANRLSAIASRDRVPAQPIAVDKRGARVRNRPANDAGLTHGRIAPRARNSVNSGSRLRPIIVEVSPRTDAKS